MVKRARSTTTTTTTFNAKRVKAPMRMTRKVKLNRVGMANKEVNYFDLGISSIEVGADMTDAQVYHLNVLAQGTDVKKRIGNRVSLKSIQMRGTLDAGLTGIGAKVRMALVYDRRPRGVLPSWADIYDDVGLSGNDTNAFPQDKNSARFKILRDITKTLGGARLTTGSDTSVVDVSAFVNLKGLPTVFLGGATGAIGDIEQGALYFVITGDTAVAGTVSPEFYGIFRTRYWDV